MIPLFHPFIPKWTILKELYNTLSGRWIGQAHKVEQFEKEFAKKYGYKNALFMNSCTSALEMAYHLIGLQKGDEVIVPVLDCTAGQMGLLRRGVNIVFADVDDDLLIDIDDVKKKVTVKTKAIVAVNLGGMEVHRSLYAFAKKHNIPVITDSAQHLGHTRGDYICYSFQAIKHITTADGGMLICKDHERAKRLRWFGIDRELKAKKNWQAWEKREMTFDIEEAGYKYQPTDVSACFGLAGLKYADKVVSHRQKLLQIYKDNLNCPVIGGGTAWLCGVILDHRDNVAQALKHNGIETNLVHLRNDIFTLFGGKRLPLKNMNRLEDKYLYLPLHHLVKEKDVKRICKIVNSVL